jgi:HEPN domain-containing protein
LTKEDHISFWQKSAEQDKDTMNYLFTGKKYVHALFFAHLMMEKLLKAHWVKDNKGNYPPKIHNLNIIHAQTKLLLTEEELNFCADMNKFQMEGR